MLAGTVPRRKLPLLCDECLDSEFVDWLRNERGHFKVFTLPRRRSDEHLWQEARQKQRLLVTSDRDFMDDRAYKLHESPGVLYIDASSTDDYIYAFARFFALGSFDDLFSRFGWAIFQGSKSSASPSHAEHRRHDADDGAVLVWKL